MLIVPEQKKKKGLYILEIGHPLGKEGGFAYAKKNGSQTPL